VILTAVTLLLSTGVFQHFDDVAGPGGSKRGWSLPRWSIMLLAFAVPGLVLSGIAWSDVSKLLRAEEEETVSGNFRDTVIARVRNFYGAVRIEERVQTEDDNEEMTPYSRTLYHGRIIHGMQYLDEDQRLPTTYYATESGVGRAIGFFRSRPDMRVGAVGLGTGTLAAYCSEPGYYFRFYEINPEIERLSNEYFTYRKNAAGKIDIIRGDARLSLEREAEQGSQRFDVLVLDAFSGDAIPTHLLTREAFEIYLKHMDINSGIIAVHISNRYLDLVPVVRGLCEAFQIGSLRIHNSESAGGIYSSEWICVTNNQEFLNLHADEDEYDGRWLPEYMFFAGERAPHAAFETIRSWPRSILWTDAYSNLFDILIRKEED
jgi:spermidine synthase